MVTKRYEISLLLFLRRLGLVEDVPTTAPPAGRVLARGVCPLHDEADNPNAFVLFGDGWACTTHHCHKDRFGCNLHGLIRHLVHRLTGEVMDWRAAWYFARNNVNRLRALVDGKVRQASAEVDRPRGVTWTKEDLLGCLEVPSAYYLGRGYRPETLQHFQVGTCVRPLPDGKDLRGWAVIPVSDGNGRPPLGYTARNPSSTKDGKWPKWMHSDGFRRQDCLFNAWAAYIKGPLILCEGPGCVMRFHEAGFPAAVATFGTSLTNPQYFQFVALLHSDRGVVIAADNDDAGRTFAATLVKQVRGVCLFPPEVIYPPQGKDFGDCTTEAVREFMASRTTAARATSMCEAAPVG